MVDIDFDLNQSHTMIQANLTDQFQEVINKYLGKTLLKPESVAFIVNGKQVNPSESVQSHMNKLDKEQNKMKVLVNILESNEAPQAVNTKSKEIICPECHESCKIKIENGKFKFYDCINNHIIDNISILDFQETQKIYLSNIICSNHTDKNMENSYKNGFYLCLSCKTNLCLLCKDNHETNHTVVKYEQKNCICPKHNSIFIKYCKQCKLNLCIMCDEEHDNHDKIYFGEISPKKGEIENQLSELETIINSFNKVINTIKRCFDINFV